MEDSSFLEEKNAIGWSLKTDELKGSPSSHDYKEKKIKMISETLKIHSSVTLGMPSGLSGKIRDGFGMENDMDSALIGFRSKSTRRSQQGSVETLPGGWDAERNRSSPLPETILSKMIDSTKRCLRELLSVKHKLSKLVELDPSVDDPKSKTDLNFMHMEKLAEILLIVSKEVFIPAHQLNKIALKLHDSEDYIRHPADLSGCCDTSMDLAISESCLIAQGRIRFCLDKATEYYNKFESQNAKEELQAVLLTLVNALKDLLNLANGFHKVTKALITIERDLLEEYLHSLNSIERSDLLEEVQILRRGIDDISIAVEKLGWAAAVFQRYTKGKKDFKGTSSPLASGYLAPHRPHKSSHADGYSTHYSHRRSSGNRDREERITSPLSSKIEEKHSRSHKSTRSKGDREVERSSRSRSRGEHHSSHHKSSDYSRKEKSSSHHSREHSKSRSKSSSTTEEDESPVRHSRSVESSSGRHRRGGGGKSYSSRRSKEV